MNDGEPKKMYHFYCGHGGSGAFFIQNGSQLLMSFGCNRHGDLSIGESTVTIPQVVKNFPKLDSLKVVKFIAKGYHHTLFLINEEVYGVGCSKFGELSLKQDKVLKPVLLSSPSIENVKISKISCGGEPFFDTGFSVLLGKNGVAYSCGHNGNGQCGVGTYEDIYSAIPMKIEEKIKQIDCGSQFTILLTNKGEIYKTGAICNEGKVNIPKKLKLKEKVKFFRAGYNHVIVVGNSGKLYGVGSNYSFQISFDAGKEVKVLREIKILNGKGIIKSGECCSYALMESGDLFGWGNNFNFQLNNANTNDVKDPVLIKSNVEYLEIGYYTSFVFCRNGVYVVGKNDSGNLGLGNKNVIKKLTKNRHINVAKTHNRSTSPVIKVNVSKIISNDYKVGTKKVFKIIFSPTNYISIPAFYAIQSKKIHNLIKKHNKYSIEVEKSKYKVICNMRQFMYGEKFVFSSSIELIESYCIAIEYDISLVW